jgi:Omp85 superfamily domain
MAASVARQFPQFIREAGFSSLIGGQRFFRNLVLGAVCALLVSFSGFLAAPVISAAQQPANPPPVQANPPPAAGASTDAAKPAATAKESTTAKDDDKDKDKKEKKKKRGAFVVAPLPISSPAIGQGIIPVVGYIFPFSTKDKISPPSVIGAAGLVTNDGSRGFAVGGQLYFKEDTYRASAGFAHGNIDYNLYGAGIASDLRLPLTQTGQAFFGEFLRRVGWKFFLGPRFITGHSIIEVKPNGGSTVPIPPDVGLHTTLTALGIRLTRDTSKNRFYPLSGMYFTFTSDFFSQSLGSKYSFQSYRTQFDKYWSLSDKQVLASDTYFCATGGEPPSYGNCIYGTNSELRGYIAGQSFTRYMITSQVEYRLELPKRFGLVIFGGLGGAIPGGTQLYGTQKFLPAGGGGLRFELSKVYHVNLRADIAQGTTGHTFSMGVGEAF